MSQSQPDNVVFAFPSGTSLLYDINVTFHLIHYYLMSTKLKLISKKFVFDIIK